MSEILNLASRLKFTIPAKQGAIRALNFNVDGNYCFTCGSDKSLKLWNPHTGTLLKTYTGHGYEVLDACGSSDNSQICSSSMDKTVILWDVSNGKILRKYRGHAGTVNCVRFNEESTIIVSGSIDGTVKCWDCKSKNMNPIQSLEEPKDSVTVLQVSNYEILAGAADGRIYRWDIRTAKMYRDTIGNSVTSVCFTRDGQCILVSTSDNSIRLMDKQTGEMLNEYTGHRNERYKIASCLDNTDAFVLSGSEDGKVYIWELVDAKIVQKLDHNTRSSIHTIAHHPEKSVLLTASENKFFVWTSVDQT